ncbi:MAG: AAA family ATPase, partial [Trebonia sp.]|uniref:ATP-binding protein n=1 Tax=Trebonia sp. TaxID=2767075 RepID=UPI003CA6B2B5
MRRWELPASDEWFVGRVAELAAIGACVDAVSGAAGRVVWVEGDPGSGKTALVNHVVAGLPAAFVVRRSAADESAA